MVETIFVLDSNKNVVGYLSNNGANPIAPFFDDNYMQELSNGAETYEFTTMSNAMTSEMLQVGNYIVFMYDDKHKMFQIMDTNEEHEEGSVLITCYCEIAGLELLTDYCEPFSIEGNIQLFFNTVLQDTNWKLGIYSSSFVTNIQQVKSTKYANVYKIIQDNIATFGNAEIEYRVEFDGNRVLGYYIDVYGDEERGNKTYKRFEYGENVKAIARKRNLYDFASAMIGVGKDNLTFKDVEWKRSNGDPADKPLGQDFIVDMKANDRFNKHGKYIKGLFEDTDITNPQDLLLKTWEKLQEAKEPKFDYDVDLALIGAEYEDIKIGDTVYIIDNTYNPPIWLEARVGKLELSFSDRTKCKCTLSNYKEIKSKIGSDIASDLENMINNYFPITSNGIADGAIVDGKIDTVYYQQITADIVSASTIVASELIAKEIFAINGKFDSLDSKYATIENLNVVNGNITNLTSEVGRIDTLINGNLTSENIHSLILTSSKVTVEDGFIKNAMIESLSVDKLLAGTISTNKFTVSSDDGGITIVGSTMQFKDSTNVVKMQLGRDAQGEFTFFIKGDGNKGVLIDGTGLKENAIADDLIKENMVATDAIGEKQINYSSFITGFNKDTNTSTIKSTKIMLNNQNQTLDIAFNQLKTQADGTKSLTESHSTIIGIMQGQIDGLISDTTIEEDGANKKIKDVYTSLKATVNGISSKVYDVESNIQGVKDDLKNNYSTTQAMNSSIEQKATGILSTVSSTYATKGIVDNLSNDLKDNYPTTSSMNSAINQKAGEIVSSVSSTYQTKDGMSDYVTNGALSVVSQKANMIDWLVKSGTSSSNMVLTDSLYSVLAENIKLSAKNVLIGDFTNYVTQEYNAKFEANGGGLVEGFTVCNLVGSEALQHGVLTNKLYNLVDGASFRVTAKVKNGNNINRVLNISANWRDSSNNILTTTTISHTTSNVEQGWSAIDSVITVPSRPANGAYVTFKIYLDDNTKGRVYLQGLNLSNMIGGNLIVDGAIDGKKIKGITIVGGELRGSSNFYTSPKKDATEGYAFRIYADGRLYSDNFINLGDDNNFIHLNPDGHATCSDYLQVGNGVKTSGQSLWLGIRGVALGSDSNFNLEFTQQADKNCYFRPGYNGQTTLGHPAKMFNNVFSVNGTSSSSDRTLKENIRYLSASANPNCATSSDITEEDLYNFVKDDLITAIFNFIGSKDQHIGFIAQDLLYNADGSDSKIGQLIVNKPNDEQSPLTYNEKIYTNVLAGALRRAILKIEMLENKFNSYFNIAG